MATGMAGIYCPDGTRTWPGLELNRDLAKSINAHSVISSFISRRSNNVVMLAGDAQGPSRLLVCKIIRETHQDLETGAEMRACLSQNANTCGSVNHPNVAEFVGVYFDDNIAAVIRRFYERGSILELLRSTETINGTERARMILGAISGVAAIHAEGVLHGNIHGGNFMVDDNDKVVLTDAGIDVAGGNAPIRGRYRWAAAELLISGSDDVPRPTTEADIWSLACTIMEMFTLTKPFPKLKFYPFVLALRGGRLIPGSHDMIPQPVWDLLRKCWALEPSKRPTAAMILAEFAALQA